MDSLESKKDETQEYLKSKEMKLLGFTSKPNPWKYGKVILNNEELEILQLSFNDNADPDVKFISIDTLLTVKFRSDEFPLFFQIGQKSCKSNIYFNVDITNAFNKQFVTNLMHGNITFKDKKFNEVFNVEKNLSYEEDWYLAVEENIQKLNIIDKSNIENLNSLAKISKKCQVAIINYCINEEEGYYTVYEAGFTIEYDFS